MLTKEFKVKNETGFHARPASQLVEIASNYESDINFIKDDNDFNCKSMMSLLSMGAQKEDNLKLVVEGNDEKEAFKKIMDTIDTFI